ncbi:hypothetical protein [Edaphobacter sp. HDX4]
MRFFDVVGLVDVVGFLYTAKQVASGFRKADHEWKHRDRLTF